LKTSHVRLGRYNECTFNAGNCRFIVAGRGACGEKGLLKSEFRQVDWALGARSSLLARTCIMPTLASTALVKVHGVNRPASFAMNRIVTSIEVWAMARCD
jgi:hypothetical protein